VYSKKENEMMEQYSIKNFLDSLADDQIEKLLVKLISEGYQGEELLAKMLEARVGVKEC